MSVLKKMKQEDRLDNAIEDAVTFAKKPNTTASEIEERT